MIKTLLVHEGDKSVDSEGGIVQLVSCSIKVEVPLQEHEHETIESALETDIVGKDGLSTRTGR